LAKVNDKVYIIIIIVLLLVSSIFIFRSCVPSDRSGFNGIRKHLSRVTSTAQYITRLNQESINELRKLESDNNRLRAEINHLKTIIDGLTEELRKLYQQFEDEIARSSDAIDEIGRGIDGIENFIDRIRETKPD